MLVVAALGWVENFYFILLWFGFGFISFLFGFQLILLSFLFHLK